MKSFVLCVVGFLVFSCDFGKEQLKKKEYTFNELTVNFVKNTRVTTFVKDGEPISGTVVQEFRSGRKNTWEVEKGLAVKQVMFYSNGKMERMLEMKNGVEHGIFVMYYSDGQKYIEQFYENGTPTGIWHRWSRDGELVETIEH